MHRSFQIPRRPSESPSRDDSQWMLATLLKELCIATGFYSRTKLGEKLIYPSLSTTHRSHHTIKMQSSFQIGSSPIESWPRSDSQWEHAHSLKELCIAMVGPHVVELRESMSWYSNSHTTHHTSSWSSTNSIRNLHRWQWAWWVRCLVSRNIYKRSVPLLILSSFFSVIKPSSLFFKAILQAFSQAQASKHSSINQSINRAVQINHQNHNSQKSTKNHHYHPRSSR